MNVETKKCFIFHTWSRWEMKKFTKTVYSTLGTEKRTVDVDVQERHCVGCGFVQRRLVEVECE